MLDKKPIDNTYSVLRNRRTDKILPRFQVVSQYLGAPGFIKFRVNKNPKGWDTSPGVCHPCCLKLCWQVLPLLLELSLLGMHPVHSLLPCLRSVTVPWCSSAWGCMSDMGVVVHTQDLIETTTHFPHLDGMGWWLNRGWWWYILCPKFGWLRKVFCS